MDGFYNNSVYICFLILQQFHFYIRTEYEIHPQPIPTKITFSVFPWDIIPASCVDW